MNHRMCGLWCWAFLLAASLPSRLQAQEVIEAARISLNLSDRGVAFQVAADSDLPKIARVVGLGDVDGDGYGDLLFRAQACVSAGDPSFPAVLIFGRPGLTGRVDLDCSSLRSAVFLPPGGPDAAGVFPAGDVDHDGRADFFFSYQRVQFDGERRGEAYLVYGSDQLEGVLSAAEVGQSIRGVTFWSSDPRERSVGVAAVNLGDFNGDRKIDLAISAVGSYRGDTKYAGKVFIILDSEHLTSRVDLSLVGTTIPGLQVLGAQFPALYPDIDGPIVGEGAGDEISSVGDVNGDGFDDVLVKSSGTFSDPKYRGRHYLVFGSSNPPPVIDLMEIADGRSLENVTLIRGPLKSNDALTGTGLGDMNGDGLPDFLIGAPVKSHDPLFGSPGAAYLLLGAPLWPREIALDAPPADPRVKYIEFEFSSAFGISVAAAGDMNGDGVPDFLVGADRASADGLSQAGEAYAIYGKRSLDPEIHLEDGFAGIRLLGEADLNLLGMTVASAGDFNGDGTPDFVATSFRSIPDASNDGLWSRAYLVYGSGGPQPLRLQKITPAWGPVRGGTAVELRGTGFSGEPKVFFGKKPAESVQLLSSYRISARTPAGEAPGPVDVELVIGADVQRLDLGFEYTPNFPEIDLDHPEATGCTLTAGAEDSLGYHVAFGDITGDGVDDLIVGSAKAYRIQVGIIKGGAGLPASLPALSPSERVTVVSTPVPTPGLESGYQTRVSVLGDVNGDGIKDLGLPQQDKLGYILFGRTDLAREIDLDTAVDARQAVRVNPGKSSTSEFTMVSVGDLTGDGIDDFAVGMSDGEGLITYVKGQRAWPREINLADSPQVFCRIHGSRPNQRLARQLLAVGDVNGDGFPDLLTDAGQGSGDIFLDALAILIYGTDQLPADTDVETFVRSGGGASIKPPMPADPGSLYNQFTLAGPGDVNGDHFADLLIGQGGGGKGRQGESYLIFGAQNLPGSIEFQEDPSAPDGIVRILGEALDRSAGVVGPAGDFNDDGFRDFLIGEKQNQNANGTAGNVYLILGGPQLPDLLPLSQLGGSGIRIQSPDFGGIGPFVGPSGDLDGDGQSDFVIGAQPKYFPDQPPADESRLNVIFGPYGQKEFLRGDANRDGVLDISDPITILAYLFSGGEKPVCIDALDTDDSGLLDITDAIYLLGFLFRGEPAPPSPFPNPGKDPTKDVLDCLGFNP